MIKADRTLKRRDLGDLKEIDLQLDLNDTEYLNK